MKLQIGWRKLKNKDEPTNQLINSREPQKEDIWETPKITASDCF